jgi:hypothetical protein
MTGICCCDAIACTAAAAACVVDWLAMSHRKHTVAGAIGSTAAGASVS